MNNTLNVKAGDEVYWRYTEGGGGGSGHRPNRKTYVEAVVRKVGPKRIKIDVIDDTLALGRSTWVNPVNIVPRTT